MVWENFGTCVLINAKKLSHNLLRFLGTPEHPIRLTDPPSLLPTLSECSVLGCKTALV